MVFETERLYARKLAAGDLEALNEMQGNFNVMKYTTGRAHTREENEAELGRIISSYDDSSKGLYKMAVVTKAGHDFVGTCAVYKNDSSEYEIGYRFMEKHWGKGYGKEIAKGLADYCMNVLHLDLVAAYVYSENDASVRILESLGMKLVSEYVNDENGKMERHYELVRV